MFEVWKDFTFESAHRLPNHGGKCARLHGHSYRMRVTCSSDELTKIGPSAGFVIDYYDIRRAVEPIVEDLLDHRYLNESTKLENPTVELLAEWLWGLLKPKLRSLSEIEIQETCTAGIKYRPQCAST